MDLKRLETFYWVTRLGSFSAAAQRLNTTQPAVSSRIRQLEHSLGVKLFEGNTRNTRLTLEGRDLIEPATEIVTRMADIYTGIGKKKQITGPIRIGAVDTVALSWLPRMIAIVGKRHPGITVQLFVALSVDLRERLRKGDLDLAFLVGPVPSEAMFTSPLGTVPMAWVGSPELPISRTRATPQNLANAVVISHSRGSDLHYRTFEWFRQAGVEPPHIHDCSSLATMIRLAIGGVGVAVLPPGLLQAELQGGLLRQLPPGPRFPGSETIAACPGERPTPITAEVIQLGAELARHDPAFLPVGAGQDRK